MRESRKRLARLPADASLPAAPKVTVYIPTWNYGRYIETAIRSVLKQTLRDWELIVIDDGSSDNTQDVLRQYRSDPRIRLLRQENKGLNVSNNIAARLARGKYIIRLDADDYFDENILLVLSNILDTKPEVGLVYPDYYHIDEQGAIIELVRRKKIDEEVALLDLPAHGAGTMIRRECLMELRGYAEEFSCQDGYDLWLRFIQRFKPYNVNLPLFYYRQHGDNLTKKHKKILDTRRLIKSRFIDRYLGGKRPKVLGLVPVAKTSSSPHIGPFFQVGGKPLLWHTLDAATGAKTLDRIVVSSDDADALKYAERFGRTTSLARPPELTGLTSRVENVVIHVLDRLKKDEGYVPDAVCVLFITSPLRRPHHIDKAVDTMAIFGTDSVIAVEEDLSHLYFHRRVGLEPIAKQRRNLRLERDAVYRETGAIYLSQTKVFRQGRLLGARIGHIVMMPEENGRLRTDFDVWLTEKLLTEWPRASGSP